MKRIASVFLAFLFLAGCTDSGTSEADDASTEATKAAADAENTANQIDQSCQEKNPNNPSVCDTNSAGRDAPVTER